MGDFDVEPITYGIVIRMFKKLMFLTRAVTMKFIAHFITITLVTTIL